MMRSRQKPRLLPGAPSRRVVALYAETLDHLVRRRLSANE
jgi:hypothetical protein